MVIGILSAQIQIYRLFLNIYQRFFQHIGDSIRDIDFTTNNNKKQEPAGSCFTIIYLQIIALLIHLTSLQILVALL